MKPILLTAWLAAFGGDIYTTNKALSQGAREFIIPTQRRLVINIILVTQAAVGGIAYKQLKREHPKIAKTLYVVAVVTHGTAAIWNATQLR